MLEGEKLGLSDRRSSTTCCGGLKDPKTNDYLPKSTTAAPSISLHNTEYNHNILSLYWRLSIFVNSKEEEVDYETIAG